MKTSIIRIGLMLIFASCFISMNNPYFKGTKLNTNLHYGNPKLETIVYNSREGIKPKDLLKNLKRLEIYDKNKRKVISINKFNSTIYLNSLRSGKYIIKMEAQGGETLHKILIKL